MLERFLHFFFLLFRGQDILVLRYCLFVGLSEERFWIDGTDEDVEGDWRTSSGEALPMGTPFWKATLEFHEPNNLHGNENCVDIRPDPYFYYMNDVNCANVANPICEQQISSKSPSKFTFASDECLKPSKVIDHNL